MVLQGGEADDPGAAVPDSLRRVDEVLARVAQQTGVEYVDAAVPARLADALD